ncbi:MAG: helix-turn-helix domain-containing protein [Firmicutes bacterium]|nr:helix-turn-helix domain-containing protein [Bacillota bacterium]
METEDLTEKPNAEEQVIAANLIAFRKNAGLTQAELAEKVNYSDKAISKWERGESLPGVLVFKQLAELYKTSVDNILCSTKNEKPRYLPKPNSKKYIITLLSVGLVWLVFLIVFTVLALIWGEPASFGIYLFWGLPVSGIVMTALSGVFKMRLEFYVSLSFLTWMIALCLFLTFTTPNNFLVFIIAAVFQVLVGLWFLLMRKRRK